MFASPSRRPQVAAMPNISDERPIYAWFISTEEEHLVFLRPQLRLPRRICFSSERPTGSIPESLICTASCAFFMKGRFFLLSGSTEPITGPAPDPVAQDDAASASEKKLRIVDALRLGPWIGTLEHGGFVLVRLDPMFRACEESEWTPTDSSWAWDRRMRQGTERARLATVDTRNRSAWDAEVEYNHNIELEVQPFNRNERSYVYTELHGGTTGQAVELGRGPRRIDTGGVIISDQHRAIAMALSVDPERSEVEVLMLNDTFWIYLAETLGLDGGMNFDEVDLELR